MTTFHSAARRRYVLLPPAGGEHLNIFGNSFSMKLSGDDTDGSLAMIEAVFPPGGNAPPHLHRTHTEAFYVVRGRFEVLTGDELIEAGPGAFCYAPRGVPHAFKNIGDEPGTLLSVINPAGYENHFREIDAIAPGQATPEVLKEIFDRYDQEPA
ncbi:cupin domain-containing protein [Streptomyces canus]|uniref:cupin domain-containing protein n=1 Tax=Streptomyces canus TaxID=58343 RepID=UPI0022587DC1|nr:cupin domain-containing protein [Streptomyces canus]MCX4856341.1 cupin domain-containing protein [Streptomyces canus]MCX5261952.1 cupin domain-containing protein [Streptomyces canus]WSW38192.1 cupin domain-containing protein [Streptomyces canus]